MSNNDDQSATHVVTTRIVHSATNVPIATFTTTISSGTTIYGTTVDMMSVANWPGLPRDAMGNPFIFLAAADTLQVTFATALTASAQINIYAVCTDF